MASKTLNIEDLQTEWPGWNFWLTDGGTVMATRRRYLSTAEIRAGLALTLPDGVTGPPLVEQLAIQQEIEAQLAESVDAAGPANDCEG